jgi:hypothetical protein
LISDALLHNAKHHANHHRYRRSDLAGDKAIQDREGRSLDAIVSELLAEALAGRRSSRAKSSFRWTSQSMKAVIDLADKAHAILDAGATPRR